MEKYIKQNALDIYIIIDTVQQVEKMGGFIITHDMLGEDDKGCQYFESNLTS